MIINVGDSGVDYASARPPVGLMAQRGVKFICRYLTEYTLKGKALTPAELAQLTAAGIPVILNYEHGELTMMGGTNAGQIAGQEAVAAAKKLGAPQGTCIVYSHDTGAWSSLVPFAFQAAYDITIAAGYRFGVYADRQCVQACLDRGMRLDIIWATNALSWGGGRHPQAHVWQGRTNINMAGLGNIDPNLCMRTFNAWLPGEHAPDNPTPTPTPIPDPPHGPFPRQLVRKDDYDMKYILQAPNRPSTVLINGVAIPAPSPADLAGFATGTYESINTTPLMFDQVIAAYAPPV